MQSVKKRHFVFIGGGHTHALVLRMQAMERFADTHLTLISEVTHTPYSGMLPGYLAGYYSYDEVHIDLRDLCAKTSVDFILGKVNGMNPDQQEILFPNRPPVTYDIASINIGSTPFFDTVEGAEQFATGAKPVPKLLKKISAMDKSFATQPNQHVWIVGGGAGGVEMALCLKRRYSGATISVVEKGNEILVSHNAKVRKMMRSALEKAQIHLLLNQNVTKVTHDSIELSDQSTHQANHVLWVTQASAPDWIRESGLSVDDQGFALVSPTLQLKSHGNVFATGDIATIDGNPRPKSGVFAVRMAKPLFANLHRYIRNKPYLQYKPQKNFLGLIGTADGKAIASRAHLATHSKLMWTWKDWIDRKFMDKFHLLEPMTMHSDDDSDLEEKTTTEMRCVGCAAKVGSATLHASLGQVKNWMKHFEGWRGFAELDDAVPIHSHGKTIWQSIDYMPALIQDPYAFGKIAANHSFSDIFAMGATAHSALALMIAPYSEGKLTEYFVGQCMAGIAEQLHRFGAEFSGGHTAEGPQLAIGLTANGCEDGPLWRKKGIKSGQALILTKPIGVGTLFAAGMQGKAKGRWLDDAIDMMLTSSHRASTLLRDYEVSAVTDVTGFGLAGHLCELLSFNDICATLNLDNVPILKGALETTRNGVFSSLYGSNSQFAQFIHADKQASHEAWPLLFDPQTSGGLLVAVDRNQAEELVQKLKESNYPDTRIIGFTETSLQNKIVLGQV